MKLLEWSGRPWSDRILGHRCLPAALAAGAVLLASPSLWLGLQLDDHLLRLALTAPPPFPTWSKGPFDAFAFFTGDLTLNRQYVDTGVLPWWTRPDFRVAFFRPLAGLTHWIDFRCWPAFPAMMHLQSLLWLAGMVAAASVLFRRVLGPARVAGLAALLFALDDGHGLPAVWLANRNASIAVLFGIVALIAHDAWRRAASRAALALSLVALLLSLAGSELGIATCAYLFAYAVFMDAGTWQRRAMSLLPAASAASLWVVLYRWFGFGAQGSGLYVDPGDVAAFLPRVAERGPVLLFGQWFLNPDAYIFLSQEAAHVMWLVACGLVAGLAIVMWPLLRRDRAARFLGLGMILSAIPACGTFPSGRLLVFAGIGGAGLLAIFLAAWIDRSPWFPTTAAWRAPAGVACWVFLVLHVIVAPVGLANTARALAVIGAVPVRAAASLPAGPAVRDQQVIVVNVPSFFASVFGPTLNLLDGRPLPRRMLVLASGIHPARVSRPSRNVLVIRPAGGFLAPPGVPRPGGEASHAATDTGYAHQMLDLLYRDATPFRVGDRVELSGLVVEVTAVTGDGRPAEAAFTFATDLDDPSLRWLRWDDGIYVPFTMPRVGESVGVPAATVSLGASTRQSGSSRAAGARPQTLGDCGPAPRPVSPP
ncbi:MAG: hypothetical protein AB1806_13115 [Acidobacteriota bacterium]